MPLCVCHADHLKLSCGREKADRSRHIKCERRSTSAFRTVDTKPEPQMDSVVQSMVTKLESGERVAKKPATADSSSAGTGEVIYRDKTGKQITKDEWLLMQEKSKKKKRNRRNEPIPEVEWGRGLVQKQEAEERAAYEAKLAKGTVGRFELDEGYEKTMKGKQRWDDPMRNLSQDPDTAVETPTRNRPACRFAPPPNRYNIIPGYRWDGVIRGNGYEERRMKEINRRQHEKEQAHMMSVSDM
eukprot:GHVT01078712.1.p2 GENE.GHVT01078712.1~~GHVT01078712.1.p2  ORF type:complete len:242 (+),score=30.40 GHVT01078712.1:2650-3375(+)